MPRSDFVRRHEAAFRDFQIFFVGALLVVKASRLESGRLESHLLWDFLGSSHTSDLKIGTPVATLPGAWHYRVSGGTGQPSVSIL